MEGDGNAGGDAGPNRRERNKIRTRRAIQAAAFELFAEQGFDRTTTEQIADRAEVSLRTFFRYFPSKEQVVFDRGAGALGVLGDLLASQPPELPAFDALRAAYAEFAVLQPADGSGEHRQLVAIFLGSPYLRGRAGRMMLAWEEAVSHGIERRGGTGDGIDPELLGAVLGAALKWGTRRCMQNPGLDLHRAVLDALDHLDERIPPVAPPGRTRTGRTPTSAAKGARSTTPGAKAGASKAGTTKTGTTKTGANKAGTTGAKVPAAGPKAPQAGARSRAGAGRR